MLYSHILLAIALHAIAATAASSPRHHGTHSLKGLNDHMPRASFPALHRPPSLPEVSTCVLLWYGPPSSTHCRRARLSGCSRNCRRCLQGLRAGFVPSGQVAGVAARLHIVLACWDCSFWSDPRLAQKLGIAAGSFISPCKHLVSPAIEVFVLHCHGFKDLTP